jgi:hypothetical protein
VAHAVLCWPPAIEETARLQRAADSPHRPRAGQGRFSPLALAEAIFRLTSFSTGKEHKANPIDNPFLYTLEEAWRGAKPHGLPALPEYV